jgi:hypothetical protein
LTYKSIGLEQDFEKAEQILRKVLSVKKVSDIEHIEERLNDLLKEKDKLNDKTNDQKKYQITASTSSSGYAKVFILKKNIG